MGTLETLLLLCLVTLTLGPTLYLIKTAQKQELLSEKELTATLLAQHALEKVISFCQVRPFALPPMTEEEPVVFSPESPRQVSWYFLDLFGCHTGVSEADNRALYWHLKPFTCEVKTYLIEGGVYKVLVYIGYFEGGRQKKILLERLFEVQQNLTGDAPVTATPSAAVHENTPQPDDTPGGTP